MAITYPSRFTLAAAMNPCPCGYAGDPGGRCSCASVAIARYMARVSGPLLDRIDIQVHVPAVPHRDLGRDASGESSAEIRDRVSRARTRQLQRFADRAGMFANAHMGPRDIRRDCTVSSGADAVLQSAVARLNLSARAYHRVLKIARTIADLDDSEGIEVGHVSEAVQYRTMDRA